MKCMNFNKVIYCFLTFIIGSMLYSLVQDSRLHLDRDRLKALFVNIHKPLDVDVRFREIKKVLPKRGTVGYLTERSYGDLVNDFSCSAKYYMTQYALAPLLVDITTFDGLVVGNFSQDEGNYTVDNVIEHLDVIHDFGDGVILFKRKD